MMIDAVDNYLEKYNANIKGLFDLDKKRRCSRLLKHLEEPLTAFNIFIKTM